MSRLPARLAQQTQVSRWGHGVSDSAECQDCDWGIGPGKMREVEYECRRHVVETGHVVDQWRALNRQVFLADDVDA